MHHMAHRPEAASASPAIAEPADFTFTGRVGGPRARARTHPTDLRERVHKSARVGPLAKQVRSKHFLESTT